MLFNKKWKTLERVPIPGVVEEIVKFLNERDEAVIHIGTDAQKEGKDVHFVTAVGLLEPRRGGRGLYTKTSKPEKECKGLHKKLLIETQLTIELGLELVDLFPETELVVHADVNPNPAWPSHRHIQEIVGYIMGCGFSNVLTKPEAWLASHVCDHVVKHKNAR